MAFTNWKDLESKMLDDLAGQNWRTSEYDVDGKTMKYRSFSEFKSVLEYVRNRAALESGSASPRTYAGNGGAGRW